MNTLGWNLVQGGRIHSTLTKILYKLIFTENRVFFSLVGPSETGKSQFIYNWLRIGIIEPKFDKSCFFINIINLSTMLCKKNENLEFVRGVNFEFFWFVKNNGTKYLFIFDDSCDEVSNSETFVDIVTAGRHRGLSPIYIKHNLFHQSKLGRDVDLQNAHIVLFKPPRDVKQVTTLGTQSALGSELVDWYRDATSVSFGHLLNDAQTITYVIVQTPVPFTQHFTSRTGWNCQKFWMMNTENLSTLPFFQSFSHKCKKLFLQSCPKEFIPFLCECIINLFTGNLRSIKRHHEAKFQREVRLLSLKRTTWKQRRDILASERG